MKNQVLAFIRDEEGATAIEYALIAGLIAVALIGALTALSGNLSTFFTGIGTKLVALAPK